MLHASKCYERGAAYQYVRYVIVRNSLTKLFLTRDTRYESLIKLSPFRLERQEGILLKDVLLYRCYLFVFLFYSYLFLPAILRYHVFYLSFI